MEARVSVLISSAWPVRDCFTSLLMVSYQVRTSRLLPRRAIPILLSWAPPRTHRIYGTGGANSEQVAQGQWVLRMRR